MKTQKTRMSTDIVSKTDHEQSPGYQTYTAIGGRSAGQMFAEHLEAGEHYIDGERYVRIDPHRFVAESMLAGMFGGRR